MPEPNNDFIGSQTKSIAQSTILSAVTISLMVLLFVLFLTAYIVCSSFSKIYKATVYVRPNTTLILSPPGIDTQLNIVSVSDCIEVYENVQTVSEYSLEYGSPVWLSLIRNVSTLQNQTIVLGQLQGIVQIKFTLLDINKCMAGRGVPIVLQNEQLDFSYNPYIAKQSTILLPDKPQVYNLSGNIDEYFKINAIVYPATLSNGRKPNIQFEECMYCISIVVKTISYNMGNVPHRSVLYPSTVDENKIFKSPIAFRSLSLLSEQTTIELSMSSVSRQSMSVSQLRNLTILSGLLVIIITITFLITKRRSKSKDKSVLDLTQSINSI